MVSHNLRNIDEPFSSVVAATAAAATAAVVIDEFDDECIDDSDEMLFFGYDAKQRPDVITGCNSVLLLRSNECNNDDDDDDDAPDGNINISTGDSSSVSGSERVR